MKAATAATVIDDRCSAATTGFESIFAEVLADVLRVDHVPVDSHFFDELGADSLLMAHFCARVRKRADLPPVSMKDIYRHPTIGSLAAALADAAPAAAKSATAGALELPTPTRAYEHVLCGALQALFYLGYSYLGVFIAVEGYQWLVAGAEGVEKVLRLVLFGGAGFLIVCAIPIAAKWLLIGRWRPQKIRLWSLAYVRFWVVKSLIWSNPAVYLFVGSPLYGLYLRALGAKVGINNHLHIGDGAQVTAMSAVKDDIPAGGRWGGHFAKPTRQWFREIVAVERLVRDRAADPKGEGQG